MPDADDFDVEYFRSLLKGGQDEKSQPPPASAPPARGRKRPAAQPSVPPGKPAPKAEAKKRAKR